MAASIKYPKFSAMLQNIAPGLKRSDVVTCSAHVHQGSCMQPNVHSLVHCVHCTHRAAPSTIQHFKKREQETAGYKVVVLHICPPPHCLRYAQLQSNVVPKLAVPYTTPPGFFLFSGARRVQQPLRGSTVTSAHGQWVQNHV